ncbi:rRNA maturation RNase YbeY [Patescibacteria group bacterium]|nr:rRNA maturation RNase YbeY [Patescibacteria group bacterium]
MSFELRSTTRTSVPSLPFKKITDDIMGASYALSLVFVGDTRSKKLNTLYRNKTYIPNVLSFPLSDTEGEVYINPRQARREAQKFGMTEKGFIGYLFIHALLHLKGYAHGDTMEEVEARYTKRYHLS